MQRHFKAASINQLWVADMTYIPNWVGFLYLAVVIDVFSRKVVGWAFGETMTVNLVINALNMAFITRKPGKVIHHSDRGSQYTSVELANNAGKWACVRPWGVWAMPMTMQWLRVFFASLECELIDRHPGLGYLSPNNFERKLNENNQIAINCSPLSQAETFSTQ